ncbi:MAG TPA: hypothetical protein V6C69_06630 [Trichormus sp.]
MANSSEAIGQQHAVDVEQKLLHNDVKGAENAFRQHYLDAMHSNDPESQKAILAEQNKLKQIDPKGYSLVMLEIAKDTGVLDQRQSRADLQVKELGGKIPGASAEDKLKGLAASEVEKHYDEITNHWFHSDGVTKKDVNEVENGLRGDLQKRAAALDAKHTFLDSGLFDKLSGYHEQLTLADLQQVLQKDADAKAHGGHRLFTDEQAKQVKAITDHWDEPAVQHLLDSGYSLTKDSIQKALKADFGNQDPEAQGGGGTAPERPTPAPEKPTPAPEKPTPAPEKPKPASDKTSHQDQDPDVIRNGEGYTYSAIRLLGLVPRNGSKHDVEHAYQEMTKEQRAEVEELVRALKDANKNKHHGVLYAGEKINTDDDKVQAILNPEED